MRGIKLDQFTMIWMGMVTMTSFTITILRLTRAAAWNLKFIGADKELDESVPSYL